MTTIRLGQTGTTAIQNCMLQVTYSKESHQGFLQRDSSFSLCILIKRLAFSSLTLDVFTKQRGTPITFLSRDTTHRQYPIRYRQHTDTNTNTHTHTQPFYTLFLGPPG